MTAWVDKIKALLCVWYPGQEGGLAAAEILLGKINPSGKLPITFEKRWEDNSAYQCYHDTDGDGRVALTDGIFSGYRHFDAQGIEPLFAFGYGLSYTTFRYANLRLSSEILKANEQLSVTLHVTNTGNRAGAEIVQLYLSEESPVLPRPPKELKGYAKVFLQPGETQAISLVLTKTDISYYDPTRGGWWATPGNFRIYIGASSRDIRLERSFSYRGDGALPMTNNPEE
jgi:beta-glucosidase